MSSVLTQRIKQKAYQIGFDLCGITKDFEPTHKDYFLDWVQKEKFAQMTWLGRNTDKRLAPQTIVPGTKSVIVVAASYYHEPDGKADHAVSRYAHGQDYHIWMKEKLEALAQFLVSEIPGFEYRTFVDTGPVIERDLAAKAGLGWIGKNTCLINKDVGSFVFLGVLFNNLDLISDVPTSDHCLTCQLCLQACPTQALTSYRLDPYRCLAYQNIEKRGERDAEFWEQVGEHTVGCDICQEVCPWNHSAQESRNTEWTRNFSQFDLGDLRKILQIDARDYKTKIQKAAISRIKYLDFMRNVFLVIANTKRVDLKTDVLRWREKNADVNLAELNYCLERLGV